MGGFECSTHRRSNGDRLDLIASTGHDRSAADDYRLLADAGMLTARDGLRWHLIEKEPYKYDFESVREQIDGIRKTGIQVIWDIFHYGFPDDLDLFSDEFCDRLAAFSAASVEFLAAETPGRLVVCPVNEISFFSWIAGEVGRFHPKARKRGDELKRQMVRSSVAAMDAMRAVLPDILFVHTDPAIHVVGAKNSRSSQRAAEAYRQAQFQAFDMLSGRVEPELGGSERYLDVLGLNYYYHNQWRYPNRRKIPLGHPDYRPFSEILREYHDRYGKPILIAETGIEDDERPDWFRYVCEQVRIAMADGVEILGVCLYPIVNHPGWEDERHCHNGLWDYLNEESRRDPYEPLLEEVKAQKTAFAAAKNTTGLTFPLSRSHSAGRK